MRIALYHNLPAGGAIRSLCEMVDRSAPTHTYDLFQVELRHGSSTELRGVHNLQDHAHSVRAVHNFRSAQPQPPNWATPGPLVQLARLAELSAAERCVAEAINSGGYDLAFVHPCQFTQAPSVLKALRIPTIYYAHEPRRLTFDVSYRPPRARRRGVIGNARSAAGLAFEYQLRRRDISAVQAPDALACNSLCTQEALLRAYGRRADLCYPGVDTDLFRPRFDVVREDSVVAVGALDPVKGHALVIAALALIPSATRPRLDIAYERCFPGYDNHLHELANEYGVELRLHYRITDHDLVDLYRRAIVTVGAAHLEPLGITPLESLSSGTPVVAVREGGYRETVLHGINGYLIDRTPAAMAAAIMSVRRGDLPTDPSHLRDTVISMWSWDAALARIHQLFDSVVTGRVRAHT